MIRASLKSIPRLKPAPSATSVLTGVASPSAQGHEITTTEIATMSAAESSPVRQNQNAKVARARAVIAAENLAAIASASA